MRLAALPGRPSAAPTRTAPRAASALGGEPGGRTPTPAAVRGAIQRINAAPTLAVAGSAAAAEPATTRGRPSEAQSTSDKYAVVEIGGHQVLVEEGRWYTTNRLAAEAGATISLGRVLALKSDGEFTVGRPYLEGVTVTATVLDDELKGPKEVIFKMNSKKHYRRKTGHRQPLTKFVVDKIA